MFEIKDDGKETLNSRFIRLGNCAIWFVLTQFTFWGILPDEFNAEAKKSPLE